MDDNINMKRMFTLLFSGLNLILLSGIFQSCAFKIQSHFLQQEDLMHVEDTTNSSKRHNCMQSNHYRPDTNRLADFPMRHVRINFHIIQDPKRTITFNREQGVSYVKQLVKYANYDLRNNKKMMLPKGNNTPVLPIRVQYVLTGKKNDPQDEGVYFHQHPELWKYFKKGKLRNIYSRRVYQKFGVRKGEVVNVFLLEHHPDSVKSPTYKASKDGVGYTNFAKLVGCFQYVNSEDFSSNGRFSSRAYVFENLLNHELGHSLGLAHTWNMNDGCDDTPRNEGCWGPNGDPPCDKEYTSNNVMDYNYMQNAYTPCQIGKIHKKLSRPGSSQRKKLKPTWCEYKEDSAIVIGAFENVVWQGNKDLEGDVIVNNRGSLTIQCRLHIPKGAKIILKPKANLVLDGATITNLCGHEWQGIEVLENPRNAPAIQMKNGAKLENVAHPLNAATNNSVEH